MKIALLTDTHWGVRGDNVKFLEYFKQYYTEFFFPKLEELNIDVIIHLGDLMDRRKFVNIYTAHCIDKYFFKPIEEKNITFIQILGNHDTYHKNTNDINSFGLVSRENHDNAIDKAEEILLDDTKILLVPWICDENREHAYNLIKKTDALYCFGHFEFSGFQMYKGLPTHDGIKHDEFKKFDLVCSGHYHHRSRSSNIQYLGAAMEYTWSDYDDSRGFAVFETNNGQLEFFDSPVRIFHKEIYDDSTYDIKYISNIDYSKFANKIIKIVVRNKTNPYLFDMFIENIEKQGVIELHVVDDHLNLNITDDDAIIDEAESTIDIFTKFVDQTETGGISKNKIKKTMIDLYNEAVTVNQ